MAKIKLTDGTIYNVADYATTNRIPIRMKALTEAEIISSLTEENLSDIRLLTESDDVFCILKNKCLRNYVIKEDVIIVDIDDVDLCRVALILGDDGRILDVVPQRYAPDDAIIAHDSLEGSYLDYRYVDGEYVYDPLPEPEQPETQPTQEERITALEAQLAAYEAAYAEGVNEA